MCAAIVSAGVTASFVVVLRWEPWDIPKRTTRAATEAEHPRRDNGEWAFPDRPLYRGGAVVLRPDGSVVRVGDADASRY